MAFLREVAWIALIASGVLFYTGFGITRLLAFGPIRSAELLLTPFLGFSLVVLVGYWCGWMGWSAGVIARVVLVLATFFNLLAVVRRRGRELKVLEHLPVLALACLAFAVAIYPVWRSRALGPIGTNGDQVLYTNVAAHLAKAGIPNFSPSEWKPATDRLSMATEAGFPLGFSYLHALLDKLSRAEAHGTFSILTAVSLALTGLSYASLAACLFRAGRFGTLLIALLATISPALLWVHYDSDGMQIMSLGMVPLAFGMSVLAMERGRRYILLPALLLAAAFVTHPLAATAFSLTPAVLYVALRNMWQRRQLAAELRTLAILLAWAGFLIIPGIVYSGKFLWHGLDFGMGGRLAGFGQAVRWLELYGLSQHRLAEGMNPLAFFQASSLFLATCAVAITLYGAWGMKGSRRTAVLSLGILYVPLLISLRYMLDYPEAFFDALTFATFPAFIGFALGCERLLAPKQGLGRRNRAIVVALILFMAATNVVYLLTLSRWVATAALDFPSLLALRHVKGLIRNGERIHVRDARNTPLLWITYFLNDYELSLAHSPPSDLRRDGPFSQKAMTADFVLVDRGAPLAEPWARTAVYENNRYRILQKDPRVLAHVDFRVGAAMLMPEQELRLEIRPEMLVVDDQAFALTPLLAGAPAILRLGAYVPAGAAVEVGISGRREVLRGTHDLRGLELPLEELPITLTLANAGTRGILLAGWLELVDLQGKDAKSLPEEEVFGRLNEEVLPGSGFFVVEGWHGLEGGHKRWTKGAAFAVFRNPVKPRVLQLEGFLPMLPVGTSPVKAHVLVNGHLLGEVDAAGSFAQTYFLPVEILSTSGWAELALRLDQTVNLKALGLSEDGRELGLVVNRLGLFDVELPPDGFIDIGTREARKYLARGWSQDEQLEGGTFVWATAPESLIWVSFPEAREFRVEMRGFPFRYPSAPPQEIGIYVNGRHLQDIPLDMRHWQIHSFKLPQAFLVPGINTFRFNYRYAVAPATIVPGNLDRRTLAVAIDFLMFRPE